MHKFKQLPTPSGWTWELSSGPKVIAMARILRAAREETRQEVQWLVDNRKAAPRIQLPESSEAASGLHFRVFGRHPECRWGIFSDSEMIAKSTTAQEAATCELEIDNFKDENEFEIDGK